MVQPVAFASLQRNIGYFGVVGVSGQRLAQQTQVSVFSGGFSLLPTRGPTLTAPAATGRFCLWGGLFTLYSGVVVTGVVTNTHIGDTAGISASTPQSGLPLRRRLDWNRNPTV